MDIISRIKHTLHGNVSKLSTSEMAILARINANKEAVTKRERGIKLSEMRLKIEEY